MSREKIRLRERESGGGGFLAFFIGLLMGIIALVGALVGVGYYIYNRPVKDTVKLVDIQGTLYDTVFDEKEGFISPNYADKLVGELLTDAASAVLSLANDGPMRDIVKLSPKVESVVDSLLEKSDSYGLQLDKEEMLDLPMSEIVPYLQENINNTPLGDLVKGQTDAEIDDPTLLAICYGSPAHYTRDGDEFIMNQILYKYNVTLGELYDVDRIVISSDGLNYANKTLTLEDGTIQYLKLDSTEGDVETYLAYEDEACTIPLYYQATTIANFGSNSNDLFNGIYLCDALGITNTKSSHPVLVSLAYGEEGVDYVADPDTGEITTINAPRTIAELKADNQNLINGIRLSDLITEDTSSATTMYLLYGREGIHWMEDSEGNVVPLEKKIAILDDKVYNEWGELIADVTPADYDYSELPEDAPVKTIKTEDGNVATLYLLTGAGVYKTTTLGAFTEDDSYIPNMMNRMTIGEVVGDDANDNILLKHLKDETMTTLPDAISNLAVVEVYEDQIFEADGVTPKSTWKYLLTSDDGSAFGHHKVNGVETPYTISDMSDLVSNMTRSVQEASLAQLYDDGMLSIDDATALNKDLPSPINGKDKLGQLNINELFNLVISLI